MLINRICFLYLNITVPPHTDTSGGTSLPPTITFSLKPIDEPKSPFYSSTHQYPSSFSGRAVLKTDRLTNATL